MGIIFQFLKVEKLKETTVKEIAHMPTYFVPGNLNQDSDNLNGGYG